MSGEILSAAFEELPRRGRGMTLGAYRITDGERTTIRETERVAPLKTPDPYGAMAWPRCQCPQHGGKAAG